MALSESCTGNDVALTLESYVTRLERQGAEHLQDGDHFIFSGGRERSWLTVSEEKVGGGMATLTINEEQVNLCRGAHAIRCDRLPAEQLSIFTEETHCNSRP